jgi:hypothetical protein
MQAIWAESLAPNGLTEPTETAAFGIGQTNPPCELFPEYVPSIRLPHTTRPENATWYDAA